MGYFVGVTSTGFVGTDELSAVTSYMPCHIFGDQMLIGLGIRVGFYLLYVAGILAVLFGVDKQFRFWHGAWGILALSLFLSMFLNLATYNLLIVDYAVLIELVLWYPVFFVFSVLFRQALLIEERRANKSDAEIRERLLNCRRDAAVSQRDVARARAYADVLKAFALYAAAEEAEEDQEAAQAELSQAVQHYVSHWHEQIEVREGDGREEAYAVDGGAVTTVYNPDLINEISTLPTRADVDKLRDLYVAALIHSHYEFDEARAAEQEVALIASEELVVKRRSRHAKHAARHFLLTASYKDQLTAAIGLLVWSMYMFGTAALNWPLLTYGNKPGVCDDVPTVYFVLAPKKPFTDKGFSLFLKIWTVGVCLVAVVTTAVALFILVVAIFGPTAVGIATWTTTSRSGRRKNKDKSVESGAAGTHDRDDDAVYDTHGARARPGYSSRARTAHSQEILSTLHRTEARTVQHRYSARGGSGIHFSLWNIPWAILLAVLLVVTIVCAELTVARQGPNNNIPLDFDRPPLHETAEILAFLIGLYSLVLTVLSIFTGLVAALLWRRKQKTVTVSERRDEKIKTTATTTATAAPTTPAKTKRGHHHHPDPAVEDSPRAKESAPLVEGQTGYGQTGSGY